MFLPFHDRNPIQHIRFPYVNYALIALTTFVFLMQLSLSEEVHREWTIYFGMIPLVVRDLLASPQPVPFEELTFVTYAFLHLDGWHLLSNMLFLWIFGDNVEDALGHLKYLFFYLACAVLAALAHFAVNLDGNGPLIGASGAVAGVMGAYALLYPHARVFVLARIIIPIPLPIPAFWMLGVWLSTQIFYAFAAADEPVAWWAHIGGMAAGAVLAALMRRSGVKLLGGRVPPANAAGP